MNHVGAPALSVRRRGGRTSSTRAGKLTGRVPAPNLALAPVECQRASPRPGTPARAGSDHDERVDLDAFRWLLTDPGQRLLARADAASDDPLEAAAQLRRDADAAHVAAALTQATLRRRALPKFGDLAGRMYFTRDGLEQATRWVVAEHRAARLAA